MSTAAAIQAIFRTVFRSPQLQIQEDMQTGDLPQWDSFKNVEILLACEAQLKIRFHSKEIDAIRTVGDLIAICDKKRSA
jgi:acyl carrier protein